MAAPNRSQENNSQQQPQNCNSFLPRGSYNPRFNVTPESMCMPQYCNNNPIAREGPYVDVKSYNERHNNNKNPLGLYCDKQESNASFHSSHSNTPKTSYASIKTENTRQCLTNYTGKPSSPNNSPKNLTQQWNFENSIHRESLEQQQQQQQNNIYTSSALHSPKPSLQSNATFLPTASSTINSHKSAGELCSILGSTNDVPHLQNIPSYMQNVSTLSEVMPSGLEQLPPNCRSGSEEFVGNSAKLNYELLNQIYSKRIADIDANVWGDKDLKICTYQEWIEMLTKINESFIINMEELEREVSERLEMVQRKVNGNCRHSQGNELMKCRKDIDTLLKYIKNARIYNSWDLQGLTFETISPSQVLDQFEQLSLEGNAGDAIQTSNEADAIQKNKLYANMKALAHEVAEKHDEVRELKRQVICLEDEIQKAQKKIQLKDDVIKELRNDLKSSNVKLSANSTVDTSLNMPPINFENQTSRSGNTQITDCNTPIFQEDASQFDSLSHVELEEQQQFKLLEKEMNEFFEMNTELNNQKMESQRKRLKDIFQKLESEKAAAYRKLDFIRRQLIDLESETTECTTNDGDSGFHSKGENDQDAKILEAVHKRLRKLNEVIGDLKKRVQKLELENSELSNSLHSEKSFSERNGEILKEVADLLSGMRGKQFSYTDIYNTNPTEINPFCEAITEMSRTYQERESRLMKALGVQNKEIEDLSQSLIENERDFNEDIHITPKTQSSVTSQISANNTTRTSTSTTAPPLLPCQTMSTSLTAQQLDTTKATTSLQQGLEDK